MITDNKRALSQLPYIIFVKFTSGHILTEFPQEEFFFEGENGQKNKCRLATMSVRRHFLIHNNETELVDFAFLGISKSICSGVVNVVSELIVKHLFLFRP